MRSSIDPQTGFDAHIARVVLEAYYPDAVRAGGAARQRAQATQGVVAGLFSVTVGVTLATADIGNALVIVLGIMSLFLWSGATACFVSAIGMPVTIDASMTDVSGPNNFVREVLRRARAERDQVGRRHRIGVVLAFAALLLTIAFWGFVALTSPDRARTEMENVSVAVADTAHGIVKSLCPAVDPAMPIEVRRLVLVEDSFAELDVSARTCGAAEGVVINLPVDNILAYGASR